MRNHNLLKLSAPRVRQSFGLLYAFYVQKLRYFLSLYSAMALYVFPSVGPPFDESHNYVLFSVCTVSLVFSSAGIVARMASKRMKRRQFYTDDILLIWAYVSEY